MPEAQDPCSGQDHGEVTILLNAYAKGDPYALKSLIDKVYLELRGIAAGRLRNENCNQLMGPTALVHEAYLKLAGNQVSMEWSGRGHFFAVISESMRRILVDQARARLALKRGGGTSRQVFDDIATDTPDEVLVDVDAALDAFSKEYPDKADLVKLRFFVGMSEIEAAESLGISRATASRYWNFAKAWLFNWLKPQASDGNPLSN